MNNIQLPRGANIIKGKHNKAFPAERKERAPTEKQRCPYRVHVPAGPAPGGANQAFGP
jgi:hypothetical protein